ncbi:MAG TPA: EAL domain-containing protein [Thermoanaerobaculia bacterium]|nr:EAL domain-containing protein [Thermoanaerobaculia bacterium]
MSSRSETETAEAAASVRPAVRRIVVADDDEDVRTLVATLLESARYTVLPAASGREAIEIATRERPDLVLLDVMMPEISGWEVCATLKNHPETQGIPVVMLSVRNEIRDMITSMQAGADDHVTKPFTKRKLLEAVERLTERRAPAALLPSAEEHFRKKNLLYDAVTQLPSMPVVLDALRDRLLDRRRMGVLTVDVEKYSHVEDSYGWEVFDELVLEAASTLKRLVGTLFASEDIVAISRPAGAEFHVFTAIEAGDDDGGRLERKARQTEETLRQTLDGRFRDRIHKPIGVSVGHAMIVPSAQMRMERVVYRALREAVRVATSREEERTRRLRRVFREILERREIRTVYQPIFELANLAVLGHEALSRGPAGTGFESPDLLFEYAIANDAVWDLEQLCLGSSASHYAAAGSSLLFVNVEAEMVSAIPGRGAAILDPLRRQRERVVLEITERSAIRDLATFRDAIERLRNEGFRVAIDDAGSGFASLQAIAELKPNFLKIANTLVTGLSRDTIKRDIVEMLLHVAARIDALCVAEGIESEEDLAECRRIGIPYGQGYFLGPPQ